MCGSPSAPVEATLTVVQSPSGQVLLGRKARGFGIGKLCAGFGGKLHRSETADIAARRELLEETSIAESQFDVLERRGRLHFYFPGSFELVLHVYLCHLQTATQIEPRGDEFESELHWYSVSAIPYHEMWPDSRAWMHVACGEKKGTFSMRFRYNAMDGSGGMTTLS
eukprot:Plantae.Rhodophyta-Palmaria_palmata.ctg11385.p1 GENE.Plantae.Rhodophyta-Palmaria_palmata.ctg11385~~Plantae.Rhodophyta-Palmaria_palmata.ctg11385.p1  ORF type:complete len:167 (-),score=20.38 Plantae.Rhodophyta-Palmaria_palmata.ctg11385:25-525(-)